MIYITLSILFSTSLFVIFKYFSTYKVNTLQAIVVNYVVAFFLGMLSANRIASVQTIGNQTWFFGAIVLGFLFVTVFTIMAKTSQYNGVSVASIAGKMSVVIPVIFGILVYKEGISFLKIMGIVMALVAVYLSSVKDGNEKNKTNFLLPVLLFLGSGVVDAALKYVEANYVSEHDVDFFSGSIFGIAACLGTIILLVKYCTLKEKLTFKSMVAGLVLGVPNYYSIVFLIKALQNQNFDSSTLFIVNNVGTVVVSTFLGVLLFKETFSLKNRLGVVLAIAGIILVTIA